MKGRAGRLLKALGIVVLALLLLALVGPFLVPVPPASGTLPPEELADADSRFMEINGLSVHYKMVGEGSPTFILLHGFGASVFSWHAVMEPFSHLGTVMAYDRPAFGLTERPLRWIGVNPYGAEANIALLLGLMDQFKVQKAILVGNSAGGTLAMQFALAHPERVQALILVDPATGSAGMPAWIRLLSRTPQMRHLGPLFVRSYQRGGFDIIRQAWHDPSRITQATFNGYNLLTKVDNYDRAMWDFTMASGDPGLLPRLGEFHLPILVVTGDDDRLVPTAGSIALAEALPGAQLAVIQDAGHVPHEEKPEDFMSAVEGFLSRMP